MSRVFAFGCSFTQYYYPTWADIIGHGKEYYNCARIGSGNQLIANRIVDAHTQMAFTEDDIILIMWSNFFRDDYYVDGWQTKGNIFFSNKEHYDLEYYVYRDCNVITNTLLMLASTGAIVIDTSINNPYNDELLCTDKKIKSILDQYKRFVHPKQKTITEHCWYPNIQQDKTRPQYQKDGVWHIEDHPLPAEHLSYVTDVLNMKVSTEAKNMVDTWSKRLYNSDSKYDTIFESTKKIKWTL